MNIVSYGRNGKNNTLMLYFDQWPIYTLITSDKAQPQVYMVGVGFHRVGTHKVMAMSSQGHGKVKSTKNKGKIACFSYNHVHFRCL